MNSNPRIPPMPKVKPPKVYPKYRVEIVTNLDNGVVRYFPEFNLWWNEPDRPPLYNNLLTPDSKKQAYDSPAEAAEACKKHAVWLRNRPNIRVTGHLELNDEFEILEK